MAQEMIEGEPPYNGLDRVRVCLAFHIKQLPLIFRTGSLPHCIRGKTSTEEPRKAVVGDKVFCGSMHSHVTDQAAYLHPTASGMKRLLLSVSV